MIPRQHRKSIVSRSLDYKNKGRPSEELEFKGISKAYAHPAVEGVMLWGFWELYMRNNGHLVNAEGDVNEADHRFVVDDKGESRFRGFHGD